MEPMGYGGRIFGARKVILNVATFAGEGCGVAVMMSQHREEPDQLDQRESGQ